MLEPFFLVNLFFDPRIIATCSTSRMMMVLMVNWINSRCFNVIHFWAHFLFFSCYFSPSHCIIFLSTIKCGKCARAESEKNEKLQLRDFICVFLLSSSRVPKKFNRFSRSHSTKLSLVLWSHSPKCPWLRLSLIPTHISLIRLHRECEHKEKNIV